MSILVLAIIILIDLIVVAIVLNWGSKHDSHTDIRSAEASKAVQVLQQQARAAEARKRAEEAAAAKAALTPSAGTGENNAQDAESDVASALGDEETRRKRREAALARKATRASTRQPETSE